MAVPSIGPSVQAGYKRGFSLITEAFAPIAMPAAFCGLVSAAAVFLQKQIVGGSVTSFTFGNGGDLSGDQKLAMLISTIEQVVITAIGYGLMVVVARAIHEKADDESEFPAPGEMLSAVFNGLSQLMPKVAILLGLLLIGPVLVLVNTVLGGLVFFAAIIALLFLSVRWVWAPYAVAFDGEIGDAAFDKSESIVSGSWLGTLGYIIVVGIAVAVPPIIAVIIVAGIASVILDSAMLSAFISSAAGIFVTGAFVVPAFAAGYESLEGSDVDVEPFEG